MSERSVDSRTRESSRFEIDLTNAAKLSSSALDISSDAALVAYNANRMNGSEESESYSKAHSESRAAEGSNDVPAETSEKQAEPSDRGTAKRK